MSGVTRLAWRAATATGATALTGAALAGLGYGLIQVEGRIARRVVGQPFEGAPDDDGVYGCLLYTSPSPRD